MKTLLCSVWLLLLAHVGFGQSTIDLTMRYNIAQSRYEVYARPSFTQQGFLWGSAQITVVTPVAVANSPFTVSTAAAGAWADTSPLYAPPAAPTLDFHGIGTSGNRVDFVAGQELLLFSFTLPGGTCMSGLRLFVNGSDPAPNPVTMPGDFTNVVYAASTTNTLSVYGSNYANTGTTCSACNLIAPTLSK